MNNKRFFIGLITSITLTGVSCTSDNIENGPETEQENLEPIEIRLGAARITASADTRAQIDSVNKIDKMGVFCLARGTNWNDTLTVLMNNVPSKVQNNTVHFLSKTGEDAHFFYPVVYKNKNMSSFYRYDFYACFPYTTDTKFNQNRDEVTATYTIDGTTDIIWGAADTEENDTTAYSDRYYRNAKTKPKDPQLKLDHMLTRLEFQLKPGAITKDDGTLDYSEAAKLRVTGITICNTPTVVDLTVASSERSLEPYKKNRLSGRKPGDLSLRGENDNDLTPVKVPEDPTKPELIGGGIMLYPSTKYNIIISALKEDNTSVKLSASLYWGDDSQKVFERGKSYKVTVTIYNPKEIVLTASLSGWDEATDPILVE